MSCSHKRQILPDSIITLQYSRIKQYNAPQFFHFGSIIGTVAPLRVPANRQQVQGGLPHQTF